MSRAGDPVHQIEILAHMHSLDVTELSAAGMVTPTPGGDVPLHHWKSFALATYAMGGTPRNPFCTWIESWMERHAPAYHGPLSLIQGDTGPGNFISQGDRVAGLVDWELAHLGDAMEDLGALRLRDVWTPFPGGVSRYFDEYAAHSGRSIDVQAVRWYSIKLCVLHAFVLAIPPTTRS
jgi:aminoglycoside phosphotransferase (APT) family kinase protein